MHYKRQYGVSRAFALPTVLIASTVLLMVLAVSVTATTAVRTTLKNQYYAQLAQLAGEAGVTYAKACLAVNANVPQWTDAKPLLPNTDCAGDVLSGATCPTAACYVTQNGNVRSYFKVGLPTLDTDGRAVSISNNGIVEIVRTSTGVVWRTYSQPGVQAAVVPNLCSGKATAALGWNPVATTGPGTFPDTTARLIRPSAGNINPGSYYLRKDFSVLKPGTYTLKVIADDNSVTYIDGREVVRGDGGTLFTGTIDLVAGCHAIVTRVTNTSFVQNPSAAILSLTLNGENAPLIVSDASWRVSVPPVVHYTSPNYYTAPGSWVGVRDIQAWNATSPAWSVLPSPAWDTTSGDTGARWVSSAHSYSGYTYPSNSTIQFRDSRKLIVNTVTNVKVSYACDDACTVYLDGAVIDQKPNSNANIVSATTVTLTPGVHQFGITVTNASSVSGILFAVKDTATNAILSRSDSSWMTSSIWSATDLNPTSYDESFLPTPRMYDCGCDAQGTTNLMLNPGIEDTTMGMWGEGYFGGPVVTNSTVRYAGLSSFKTTTNSTVNPQGLIFWAGSPVPPGRYTCSVWARAAPNVNVYLAGRLYDVTNLNAGGDYISEGQDSQIVPLTATWQRLSVSFDTTFATKARIGLQYRLSPAATGVQIWGDNAMCTAGPDLYNYADGTSPGWKWQGTVNGSVSSGPLL